LIFTLQGVKSFKKGFLLEKKKENVKKNLKNFWGYFYTLKDVPTILLFINGFEDVQY